jgi:UDP-N-acetyl-D-galactosamine dehydrogenase
MDNPKITINLYRINNPEGEKYKTDVFNNYGLQLLNKEYFPDLSNYSGVILAVSHDEFRKYNLKKNDGMVLYDVKGFLPIENVDARL